MLTVKDEFDTVSLSLVKREIELVLARADEGIIAFSVTPDEYDALKRNTLAHLHQVSGVLRMIGLEPAGRVTGATEKLVELLASSDVDASHEVVSAVRGAIKAVNQYLEDLMGGEPTRPLTLFPAYRTVLAATGSGKVSEIDLFYPDLTRSPSFTDGVVPETDGDSTKLMKLKRTEFQKGILNLLRGADFQKSLGDMGATLAAIDATSLAVRRVLWWIAMGFLEGLRSCPTPPDVFQKQLCGRVDLQIKRQLEDASAFPEGFIRELLLAIAYMPPATHRVREIQETYSLANFLPRAESAEATRVQLFLNNLREQVEAAEDTWLSFSSGNRSSLGPFVDQTTQLSELARGFNNASIQGLFTKLAEVANDLNANPRAPGDTLTLEVATALLVARDALDSYPRLDPNFERLAEMVVVQVAAALAGQALPANSSGRLIDISWAAREKELFAQLGQEILNNLNQIEEVLDGFFRDPTKRPDLAKLPAPITQVRGALAILEREDAVLVLKAGNKLVEKFAADNTEPDPQDTELTAEAFSNLGLFVSALQQRRENPNKLLHPVLARFGMSPSQAAS
jgi:chemosensory pili system protein ChpA (sensor histidine kinase/response regulator)